MLNLILILFLAGDAQAQSSTPPKKINTQLYEQDPESESEKEGEKTSSFTAKVKLVRQESDGVEVFFEGETAKGTYSLYRSTEHYAKLLKALEDSRKPQGPAVSVTADAEKRIKNVEKKKSSSVIPADPNKAWDYGKIPD